MANGGRTYNSLGGISMSEHRNLKIETEAAAVFVELDRDGNGYLTRNELQMAQQSQNATTRLVAEALTEGYDLVKKLSSNQLFAETQITLSDIKSIAWYRDDKNEIPDAMADFPKLDLNGDGFVTHNEHWRVGHSPDRLRDIKNYDFYSTHNSFGDPPRNQYYSWRTGRIGWLADRSNDEWGPETSVSMADLKVLEQAANMIRKMDSILNKPKKP